MSKDLPQDTLLINYKELCRLLNISPNHFFNMRATGRFPIKAVRLGHSVRYSKKSVEKWVREGCKPHFREDQQ